MSAAAQPCTSVRISASLHARLQANATASGTPVEQVAEEAITRFLNTQEQQQQQQQEGEPWLLETAPQQAAHSALSGQRDDFVRTQSLLALYISEPIISLVDGLLQGDHSVADCLAKGNFGLGTLDLLDGELVVLDGVAYHQGAQGVKVLTGEERTPFMVLTMLDKARCRQAELEAVASFDALEAQLRAHFRSKNVVYALLIEGTFSSVKCRAVCKQEGNRRLKDVAADQVVFEYSHQQEGCLVGFWCPAFVGAYLNVPGFHFHFLSADKARGGHVLQLEMQPGATAWLQEIHRTQVDLPFSEAWLDRDLLLKQASAELAAAEKDRKG